MNRAAEYRAQLCLASRDAAHHPSPPVALRWALPAETEGRGARCTERLAGRAALTHFNESAKFSLYRVCQTMSYAPRPSPHIIPVSTERTAAGETLEYAWYSGDRGPFEGVVVTRTDRYGMRWKLELDRRSLVTVRVAAGLLGVTPMTIANWLKQRTYFPNAAKRNGVVVIPLRDVERVARLRGKPVPFTD